MLPAIYSPASLLFAVRQQLVAELEIDERERHNELKKEYQSLLTENVSVIIIRLAWLFINNENVRTML